MNNNFKQESSVKDAMSIHIHGLWGYYFKTNDFQNTFMIAPSTDTGLFPTTDGLSQFPGIESETIGSVRFIGHIKASESAAYEFSTSEEKNTIIQINGRTIQGIDSEPILISMNKNDICNIIIEYRMASAITPLTNHELFLYWQINGGEKVKVPFQSLYQPDLSAKKGDDRFINAYPAISLFGTAGIDYDSDGDKIPDVLEKNGYTVDPSTLKIIEWKDEYLQKGWQKYISNPFHSRTAGDPYSDSEKVLNRMPSTDKIARDPFIAAFPAVGISLENIIISKNQDFTDSKDYTTSSSKTLVVSGGAKFSEEINFEGPNGGLCPNFSSTDISSSTWTSSYGTNVHINETETAFVNGNIRFYNNGNSTIFDVAPSTSIVVNHSKIATIKAQPNEIGDKLGYGEYYPSKEQEPIVLNTLEQFNSNPISLNYKQFTAINDYHKPVLLETNHVNGSVARYNFDGSITYQSWTPYLGTINERTARIVIDYGDDQEEQKIAGNSLDDIYDATPEITLKQALIKAFGVTENTADGSLSYKYRYITETSVTIIYDQTTLNYMNKQMQISKDYNIYNITLEPKMQFLIILPDLIDYAIEDDNLFVAKNFNYKLGGINNTPAYYTEDIEPSLLFNPATKRKLRENTRYLLSGYMRIEQGNHEVTICVDPIYKTNVKNFKDFTFNNNYNKFSFHFNVFEPFDLHAISFQLEANKGTHFYLDNLTGVPLEGETYGDNLVLNPQFDDDLNNWGQLELNNIVIEKEMGPNKESVVHIKIDPQRNYIFGQSISVKKHTTYIYSFDINVKANPNQMQMSVFYNGLYYSDKNLGYLRTIGAMDKWYTVYNYFNSEETEQIEIMIRDQNMVVPIDFMATNFKLRELEPPKN